jgi:hypothetical protein
MIDFKFACIHNKKGIESKVKALTKDYNVCMALYNICISLLNTLITFKI